jgi:hypothetical protein
MALRKESGMTERRTYSAVAERDGRWWLVRIPELDTMGQARTAREFEQVARDVIAGWEDIAPDSFDVHVSVDIPADVRALWERAAAEEERGRAALQAAAEDRRIAISTLRAHDFTLDAAAAAFSISKQRVHQLSRSGNRIAS